MIALHQVSDRDEIAAAAADLEGRHPRAVVRWALERFAGGRVAIVTGLQSEGMAVVDMAIAIDPDVRVVTIDTGRLPEATYRYLDMVREHYGRGIEIAFPDQALVQAMVNEHGANAFYRSPERRLDCCHVRKVEPLERVLVTLDCWLTGLRRSQSRSRASTEVVAVDDEHGGVVKVNPLASWSAAEVVAYLEARGVPRHPLYAEGYRSIGCAPCTRPVQAGEDPRSGRWWWENGVDKECGIHGRPLLPVSRSA